MKRFLSYPLMGLALLAFWLLLNQSLAPGHILLGALIAATIGVLLPGGDKPENKKDNADQEARHAQS